MRRSGAGMPTSASSASARSRAARSLKSLWVRIVSVSCRPIGVKRVERGQRILEHHADRLPAMRRSFS